MQQYIVTGIKKNEVIIKLPTLVLTQGVCILCIHRCFCTLSSTTIFYGKIGGLTYGNLGKHSGLVDRNLGKLI